MLGGDVAGAGLGTHGRDTYFLGDFVHRDIGATVNEAEDRDSFFIRDEPTVGRNSLLVLAGAVLNRQHHLAAHDAALLIEIIDRDFAAAFHELSEAGFARRGKRRDHAKDDGLLGKGRRRPGHQAGRDSDNESPPRHDRSPSH